MFFFWISQRHQCSPITIQQNLAFTKTVPAENFAGYEVVRHLYDLAECPVCGEKYEFNIRNTGEVIKKLDMNKLPLKEKI